MLRYKGGDTVKRGFYASMKRWTIEMVDAEAGVLAGDAAERYARIPVPVMLGLAPIMGATFVIFLPLIGFVLLGRAIFEKVTGRSHVQAGRRAA